MGNSDYLCLRELVRNRVRHGFVTVGGPIPRSAPVPCNEITQLVLRQSRERECREHDIREHGATSACSRNCNIRDCNLVPPIAATAHSSLTWHHHTTPHHTTPRSRTRTRTQSQLTHSQIVSKHDANHLTNGFDRQSCSEWHKNAPCSAVECLH
jgi:hypothetical protein